MITSPLSIQSPIFVTMRRLFFFLSLVSSSLASALSISDRNIVIYNDQRSSNVEVTNTNSKAMSYVVTIEEWQRASDDTTSKVVAYPPIFNLSPGEKQNIRFLIKRRTSLSDSAFRLKITESPQIQFPIATVNPNINFSFPVYLTAREASRKLSLTLQRPTDDQFIIYNNGEHLVEIIGYQDALGKKKFIDQVVRRKDDRKLLLNKQQFPVTLLFKSGQNIKYSLPPIGQ